MATTWTPIASVVQTTVPNDLTGNSLSVAPVSGDNNPVVIKLSNGTTTLFSVNAAGNIAAAASAIVGNQSVGGNSSISGNETVGGTLTVSGSLTTNGLVNTGSGTAAGLFSSIAGTAAAPSIGYTAQTDTGVYLATTSTSAAILALAVNGVQALALSKAGITVPGTLGVSGTSTLAGLTAGSITDNGALSVSGATTLASLSATSISAASLTLSGNLTVNGNETISGTETIAGLLTANGNVTTPLVTTTQAATVKTVSGTNYVVSNVSFPGSFGDGSAYPPSGVSSDSLGNLLLNYQGVPAIRMANPGYSSANGTSPSTAYPTQFLSGSYAFNVAGTPQLTMNSSAVKFGYTANTIPVTMQAFSGNILQLQNGGSSPAFTTQTVGTVDTSGNATFAGVLKGTSVTFGDGTSQTTAYTTTSAANQQRYYANSTGTTALPAFTYNVNTDTGEYLKNSSTTAAVLGLSVNATDAMTLTKTGVTIPGTLAITGATTASGLVTAPNVTLGSGGKLTFGDGTSLTSANGSASTYVATNNGTVSAPTYTFSNNTDTGAYLNTASTTAAVLALTVNATNAMTLNKTGVTIPGTLTLTGAATLNGAVGVNATLTATNLTLTSGGGGKLTFADGTSLATAGAAGSAATFTATAANGGSVTAPVFLASASTNTGIYFTTTPALNITANGTAVAAFSGTVITLQQPTTTAKTITSTTASGTASFVSTQGFKQSFECSLWNSAYSANTSSQMKIAVTNDGNSGAAGSAPFTYPFAYAGSVTGISFAQSGPISGTNTFSVYKNGTSVVSWTPGSNTNGFVNYTKGTYAFAAGDVLTMYYSSTGTGNTQVQCYVNVEQGA